MANMHRNPLPHQEYHVNNMQHNKQRNDLHLTSTGVGHHSKLRPRDPPYDDKHYPTKGEGLIYRGTPQFPRRNLKQTMNDLLPPSLAKSQRPVISDHYLTTTAQYHSPKQGSLPDYKLAGDLGKVLYIQNFTEKLEEKPWRQPLTMRNQRSECQDQYRGALPLEQDSRAEQCQTSYNCGPQPPQYRQHDNNGPSKRLIPSTHNPATAGSLYYTMDRSVLRKLDPYCTTNNQTHRPFSDRELESYPRKDIATYWDCEGYPKAWGHGTNTAPLPLYADNKAMVDTAIFKSAITTQLKPKSGVNVPHSGLDYKPVFSRPVKESPVMKRPTYPQYNSHKVIPVLYQTANSTYGTIPRAVELLQKMQRAPLDMTRYGRKTVNMEQVTIPLQQKVPAY